MNAFSLKVVTTNLTNNPETLTIAQLLVYVNEIIASNLSLKEKVTLCDSIRKALSSSVKDISQTKDIIQLAKALSKFT